MKDFRQIWKQLAKDKKLDATCYVQRALLIATNSKRNVPKEDIVHILLDKYFTPITNETKLANGQTKWDAIRLAALIISQMTKDKIIFGLPADEIFDSDEEKKTFMQLLKSINYYKIDRKYIYYFTAQDMSPEQQGVQAGHALFALGSRLGKKINPHEIYFQWIGAKDSSNLSWYLNKYKDKNPVKFYEPDQANRLTSFALPPIEWYKRGDLTEHPLLVHST